MKKTILILFLTFSFSNHIEQLVFSVYFNEMKAGHATLNLSEDAQKKNYIINFELKSNKYLDVIYKLRETTSIVANRTDFSIYEIEKYTRQGRRKKSYSALFNYESKVAHINKTITTFKLPVYDPINIIYYLRNNLSLSNDAFTFDVISKNKLKTISMSIIGEENILFNDIEYDCLILGPSNSNKLKNTEDIKIWITKTNNNLPLIIEKKAKLGVMKMELENIEYYE